MKRTLRFLINIVIAVAVPASWVWMALSSDGPFAAAGFGSLKFYTVLSNWMAAFGAFAYVIFAVRRFHFNRTRGKLWPTMDMDIPHGIAAFKLVSCVCVMITFLTVMVFLGPMFGYAYMFLGANFWFHLTVPLLALFEVLLFREGAEDYGMADNLWCVVPTIFYGIGYFGNNFINGIGEGYETNDWYGFLLWGWPAGFGIFAFICLIAFLLGLILRKLPHGL